MQVIFGIIFHFIGGFASGSFYVPFKKVKGWAWESFWIVGGLFSWSHRTLLAALLDYTSLYRNCHYSNQWLQILTFYTYLFGLLWGIGGLTYGLGVRYLGVSLGSTIILGLCAVFGALIPSVYYNFFPEKGKDTISILLHSHWGQFVLLGILICVIGIIICGKAGTMKEKELIAGKADTSDNKDYRFGLGIFVAIVSGVLSACFNFGLEAGKHMADSANDVWKAAHPGQGNFLFSNNVTYVVLLWGGLTTNFVWCMILNARNKTFGNYVDKQQSLLEKIYLFCALAKHNLYSSRSFSFMGWAKVNWVTAPVRGYCTWHLLYWLPIFGGCF